MTSMGPEDAGRESQPERLIAALGDKNWRARKHAAATIAKQSTPDVVTQVLQIFRTQHQNLSQLNAAMQILTLAPVDVVPALVELLQTDHEDVRGYSALALGLRGDPNAIPALIAALSDVSTNVQVAAIEALGALEAAAAVDRLVVVVESLQFELAFPALDALRKIGDGRISHRLVPLVEHPLLCEPVVEALGDLGDEEVVPLLLEQLTRHTVSPAFISSALARIHNRLVELYGCGAVVVEMVRSFANHYPLALILHTAICESPTTDKLSLLAVYSWLPGREVDATLVQLVDEPELQEQCIALLARRRQSAEPFLLQRIEHRGCDVEPDYIELLGSLGDPRFIPALLSLLGCEDDTTIAAALDSLARIQDERTYQPAMALLGHTNLMVRDGAVSVLNSLAHPSLRADLHSLLQDPNPLKRESAVKIACYLGVTSCQDLVFKLCSDPEAIVRQAVIANLPSLEDDRVSGSLEYAIATDTPHVRARAVGALADVGGQQAVSLLERALDDEDVWVRYNAVRSLGKLDRHHQCIDRINSIAMSDPAVQVRIAATDALANYGSVMLPALRDLLRQSNEDLAEAAISALGRLQLAEAIPDLTAMVGSGRPRLQMAAIRALGASKQVTALTPLKEVAGAADAGLVREAIAALGILGNAESCEALLWLAQFPRNRKAVIAALLDVPPAAVTVLLNRLPALPLDVSRSVIEVLSRMRSSTALDGLELGMVDPRPAIRFAALAAISHSSRAECLSLAPLEGGC
jgi:HEAT repeat protein